MVLGLIIGFVGGVFAGPYVKGLWDKYVKKD
jgi:hypothetical protein